MHLFNFSKTKSRGFTLVELVLVIVLLGILSVGISGFLSMGSQIFIDVKNRASLISIARFAIERVTRDVRSAVPNSINVTLVGNRQCIEFVPIIAAANYIDVPALPGEVSRNSFNVIDFGESERLQFEAQGTVDVVVYPLDANDLNASLNSDGASKLWTLNNISFDTSEDPEWEVSFSNSVLFEEDSPTSNLFFIDSPISYCVFNQELRRYVGGNPNNGGGGSGVLMANNIHTPTDAGGQTIFPFELTNIAQFRNATVMFVLQLEKNDEVVVFNNEIHVPNVP